MVGEEGFKGQEAGRIVEAEKRIRDDAHQQTDEKQKKSFVPFLWAVKGGSECISRDKI